MDVRAALDEDLGSGDVTSLATVPADARAVATITQKVPGVVFGLDIAEEAFRTLDDAVELERLGPEGEWGEGGPVLRIAGDARAILGAERTALNILQRLSGVATLTARYVRAVEGTGVKILDTRKTTPGMRALEKAAVRAGGGHSHRFGLFDMVLVKENHAAAAGGVGAAVHVARAAYPDLLLEVECRDEAEVAEALDAGAPRILLDNMNPKQLSAAVAQVDGRAELECSGGMTLETVRDHAVAGLDWISVGALTHSAPALDLSLILEPLR
ncbi:MAG: carboxylating nicotinate-nucleotide diphosphorylase [Solirubrobacteraceae bacterium]